MIATIGGVGGSGTRAVAQILKESGIYMGDLLNSPLDNLLFTCLFKNPEWFTKSSSEEKTARIRLFTKYMVKSRLSLREKYMIIDACKSNPVHKSGKRFLLKILLKKRKKNIENEQWGWKEPNTQFYMKEISVFFPDIKYIHVIRNGLDMAFSRNKQQLLLWGFLFNIHVNQTDGKNEISRKQLEYWIQANKHFIAQGRSLLGQNFHLVNHSLLCHQPEEEIDKLLNFLRIEVQDTIRQKLIKIPSFTASDNRYIEKDLSIFSRQQIEEVKSFGFDIKPGY